MGLYERVWLGGGALPVGRGGGFFWGPSSDAAGRQVGHCKQSRRGNSAVSAHRSGNKRENHRATPPITLLPAGRQLDPARALCPTLLSPWRLRVRR